MKKATISLAIFFASVVSFATAAETFMEIECGVNPIDRAKIHPRNEKNDPSNAQVVSENWSGYAAAASFDGSVPVNDTVTYAAGEWTVPTLLPTTDGTYSAIWVGIDGYLSPTVEQIGTSHNWINGAQQNYAWFEMYPNGSYEIVGFPLNNGDVISARIGYKGDGLFKLVLFNHTQGVSYVVPSSYTVSTAALRSSAEWVVEAPFSGGILPLSDFKLATFNYCSAIINGVDGLINNGAWMNNEITMESSTGAVEAQPTALLKGGSCFQVAWKSE